MGEYMWRLRGGTSDPKKYLYEMEYEQDDAVHTGDLRYYSDMKTAAKAGKALDPASAENYWKGVPQNNRPQFEVLVRKATVKSRQELPPSPQDVMKRFWSGAR